MEQLKADTEFVPLVGRVFRQAMSIRYFSINLLFYINKEDLKIVNRLSIELVFI